MNDSGIYVAYLSTWHYIIEIEKRKKICFDAAKIMILSMVLSELTTIRKILFNFMKNYSTNIESPSSILKNASPKLQLLMKILSDIKRSDICLVFVERRITAKILYHFIKVLYNFKIDSEV